MFVLPLTEEKLYAASFCIFTGTSLVNLPETAEWLTVSSPVFGI